MTTPSPAAPSPRCRRWRSQRLCFTAALAGEDRELSLPTLEAQIRSLTERQLELFQLAVSAGPDCLDYDEEIQRVNMAKTSLMAKKAELEREGRTAAAFDRRMEDIANELA